MNQNKQFCSRGNLENMMKTKGKKCRTIVEVHYSLSCYLLKLWYSNMLSTSKKIFLIKSQLWCWKLLAISLQWKEPWRNSYSTMGCRYSTVSYSLTPNFYEESALKITFKYLNFFFPSSQALNLFGFWDVKTAKVQWVSSACRDRSMKSSCSC